MFKELFSPSNMNLNKDKGISGKMGGLNVLENTLIEDTENANGPKRISEQKNQELQAKTQKKNENEDLKVNHIYDSKRLELPGLDFNDDDKENQLDPLQQIKDHEIDEMLDEISKKSSKLLNEFDRFE